MSKVKTMDCPPKRILNFVEKLKNGGVRNQLVSLISCVSFDMSYTCALIISQKLPGGMSCDTSAVLWLVLEENGGFSLVDKEGLWLVTLKKGFVNVICFGCHGL